MRTVFSMVLAGGVIAVMSVRAFACGGGGGGCGRGGGGYGYGGGRAIASGKIAGRAPMLARSTPAPVRPRGGASAAAIARQPAVGRALRAVGAISKVAAAPVAIYTCPMHPQVQWTNPTDCPICGLKLKLKAPQSNATKRPSPSADEHADMDGMDDFSGTGHAEMDGMGDTMMCCAVAA